jgi:hypothetical protein
VIATALQWMALLLLFALVLGLARQVGHLATVTEGAVAAPLVSRLLQGDPLPSIEVEAEWGNVDLRSVVVSEAKECIVLVVSDGCSGCGYLVADTAAAILRNHHKASPDGKRLVVAQLGRAMSISETDRATLTSVGAQFILDKHMSLSFKLGMRSVPSALSLDVNGNLIDQVSPVRAEWIENALFPGERPIRSRAPRQLIGPQGRRRSR